jgi:hypothetical protein
MSRHLRGTVGAALLCCVALSSQSQTQPAAAPATANGLAKSLGLIIYPAKGQTAEQQGTDEQQTTFKKAMGTCLQGRGYTTG